MKSTTMSLSVVAPLFCTMLCAAFGVAAADEDESFFIEVLAQDGEVRSPMAVSTDLTTGITYVGTPWADCTNKDPAGERVDEGLSGFVGMSFTLPSDGLYQINAKVRTPDSLSDSFWAVIDNGGKQQWATKSDNTFHWAVFDPAATSNDDLSQQCHFFQEGLHSLKLFVREPGADIQLLNITAPPPMEFTTFPEGCSGGCRPSGGSLVRLNHLSGLCGPDTVGNLSVEVNGQPCTEVDFEDATIIVCLAPPWTEGQPLNASVVITQGTSSVTTQLLYQAVDSDKAADNKGLIIGVVCGAGAFAIIAAIIVYKSTTEMRAYRKKFHTASIAEDMAEKVAKMELDQLEYLVDIENPTKTQRSFQTIVKALTYYKTYLPEALFTGWKREDSGEMDTPSGFRSVVGSVCGSTAPGADSSVAIVFTDIQGSTSIWESSPSAMRKALKIHNSVIRKALQEFKGYEVKTIGDAFMVAFDDCIDACCFALAVQESLYERDDWPSDLANCGLPHVATSPGWKGLRLRLGVNWGDVDVEVDPFTGKSDYFGQTVNKAARIENACIPGGVAVAEEVIEVIRSAGYRLLGNPIELPMTRVALRGVQGTTSLALLLPQSLAARKNDLTESLLRKQSAQEDTLVRVPSHRQKAVCMDPTAMLEMSRYETFEAVASASVGHIRLGFTECVSGIAEPHHPVNTVISGVLLGSERTEGSVISLHSNTVIIGWNTMHRCSSHLQAAVRFAGLVHKTLGGNDHGIKAHIGIGTSNILYGKVGTRDHKFVTVIGECVEMSERIVTTAKELGVFALSCSLPGHRSVSLDPGLRGLIRPVSIHIQGKGKDPVNVYELRCSAFQSGGLHVGFSDADKAGTSDWGWTDEYTEAFKAGDFEAILTKSSDEVLIKVARRMEGSPLLQRVHTEAQLKPPPGSPLSPGKSSNGGVAPPVEQSPAPAIAPHSALPQQPSSFMAEEKGPASPNQPEREQSADIEVEI